MISTPFQTGGLNVTTLIFVRHGVTAENLNYTLIGHTDPPLHEFGVLQAKAVANALQNVSIDCLYSSPLKRCLQTASVIAERRRNLEINTCPALSEIHLGIVDGMSSFLAYERYKSLMDAALDDSLPDFQFPSGESRSAALHRFQQGLESIVAKNKEGTVCIVSHGGPLGLWLADYYGDPLGRFRHWQPHHASIAHVTYRNGKFDVEALDNTDHLSNGLMKLPSQPS
jgi:broad specificity phosphatase PhoE